MEAQAMAQRRRHRPHLRARCHRRCRATRLGDRRGRALRPPALRARRRQGPRGRPGRATAAAALSLLAFARRRLPGIAKVRVFDPDRADHGFESRHTVLQIVNDDMPFLVDSVANELIAARSRVHLLAHPVLPIAPRPRWRSARLRVDAEQRAPAGIDDASRSTARPSRSARRARRGAGPRAGRGAARGRRLAADAARRLDAIADLAARPLAPTAENEDFLRWLEASHFTFLGHRRYRYVDDAAQPRRPALRDRPGLGARHPAPRRGRGCSRRRPGRRRGDGALRPRPQTVSWC